MLEVVIGDFIDYCKISDFADKSIETLKLRVNEFNDYIKHISIPSLNDIAYKHIRKFAVGVSGVSGVGPSQPIDF